MGSKVKSLTVKQSNSSTIFLIIMQSCCSLELRILSLRLKKKKKTAFTCFHSDCVLLRDISPTRHVRLQEKTNTQPLWSSVPLQQFSPICTETVRKQVCTVRISHPREEFFTALSSTGKTKQCRRIQSVPFIQWRTVAHAFCRAFVFGLFDCCNSLFALQLQTRNHDCHFMNDQSPVAKALKTPPTKQDSMIAFLPFMSQCTCRSPVGF